MARSSVKRVARKVAAKAAPKAPGKGHNKPPKEVKKDGGKGRDATAEQIELARDLGWKVAAHEIATDAILKRLKSVGKQKPVKLAYWDAYIAKRLFATAVRPSAAHMAEATRVRKMPVADRSKAQKDAYNGATTSWSRILARMGLTSSEKPRGTTGPKGADERETSKPAKPVAVTAIMKEAEKVTPQIPTAKTAKEIDQYLMMRAAQDLALINKYRTTANPVTAKIVENYHDGMKAIGSAKPTAQAAE